MKTRDKLKIKLSIADRVYPLSVYPEQEEGLRLAASQINNVIKHYEENYAVRDKQDVLAMSALQFASKIEQNSIDDTQSQIEIENRLKNLNKTLLDFLN